MGPALATAMVTSAGASQLDYATLVMGLAGGLALFLYGMRKLTEALKTVAGGGMRALLAKLTTNNLTGALAGALVTAVVQSSSVTTVIVVGFISAGVMSFSQSVGVIMGANVGTTITAQIIAFKVTAYALPMIAAGLLLEVTGRSKRLRHYGTALLGLGLLFFGMELMSEATRPLRTHAPFVSLMQDLRNPWLGVLAGLTFTALVQSSSATTGIVIVLGGQGFMPLEAGIALIFGGNVGTCVTVLLSAIGKPRDAAKAAVVHTIFNLLGVLIWLPFLGPFTSVVRELSPSFPDLAGAQRLAAEVPRQVANGHTLFNVMNTALFLAFSQQLARLADRLVPRRASGRRERRAVFLEDLFLSQPAVALEQVKLELLRLGEKVLRMARRSLTAALEAPEHELQALADDDQEIDDLHAEILAYLGALSLSDLIEPQPRRVQEYLSAANYLENAADLVEADFVSAGRKRLRDQLVVDDSVAEPLRELHERSWDALRSVLEAFRARDVEGAQAVLRSKEGFDRAAGVAREALGDQLTAAGGELLDTYRVAVELVESLSRLHTLARRLARAMLDFRKLDSASRAAETTQSGGAGSRKRAS
jgi:phosphate:Na+ symporter